MYKKVDTDLNFIKREEDIITFWNEEKIFEKTIKERENAPIFTFYDGPPTANGMPHVGHILTRAIKDLIPRYKTMKGYQVLRKAGWDTHGLPVELEVEKSLGLEGKTEIEAYGVEKFIEACKESVWKYESAWEEMSERVGFWVDMDNPYITYENEYIESVWWAIKEIDKKGLLYHGHRIVPYCPRCGTALSSHEVAQGYKDIEEESIFAKFKVTDKENEYFVAWTTTPWTLPSNVGLAMNPEEEYAKVAYKNEILIMAKELVKEVLKEDYEIVEILPAKDFEHMAYEPLFDYMDKEQQKDGFYIVLDDFVTLDEGTGIVHIAPAFGEDDSRVSKKYGLPFVQYVDEEGNFPDVVTDFAGLFVKEADPKIVKKLEKENKVLYSKKIEHSYPFCWRCDTPLLYYARDSWFIAMEKIKENLLNNNEKINWYPDNIKHGRFGNWIENVVDWGISRERYWGTPLPVWLCDCGHREVIGSVEELVSKGENVDPNIELHKPYIDEVKLICTACGARMSRVPEVIDAWLDSGSMPFAQWHYPFENQELFHKHFPADFISEAVDQTRGWFYSLLALSTALFDKPTYDHVVVLGHVQDAEGQKMSKSAGNSVLAIDALNDIGADALRWHFYVSSAPWLPSRYSKDIIVEGQRRFLGTLWNTYAFYILYAQIDSFDPTKYVLDIESLSEMDKWILSKLHSVTKEVTACLDTYKITEASRALDTFVDELSNWYVRRTRERFWASGMEQDKINAYMTLYTVLETCTRLIAPFTPFISEMIYQNMVLSVDEKAKPSVHLTTYPEAIESFIDKELESQMDITKNIVQAGRSARNAANMKIRQPLAVMYVQTDVLVGDAYQTIIKEELNIKKIEMTASVDAYVTYAYKPQLRTLGPKYGKELGKIQRFLSEQSSYEFLASLEETPQTFEYDGISFELSKDDVLFEVVQTGRYITETDRQVSVVLDTQLDEKLIEEGFVREVISKIQHMRKEADFDVMEYIEFGYETTPMLSEIIEKNKEWIKKEVLALSITTSLDGYVEIWDINGESAKLSVKVEG